MVITSARAIRLLVIFTLPATPESARTARRYVRAAFAFHGLAEYADDAEIITSELVTNVIRHVCADGTQTLHVCLILEPPGHAVTIAVCDSSPVMNEPQGSLESGLRDLGGDGRRVMGSGNGRVPGAQAAVIGANIRVLRRRKGWTQAELGTQMGWASNSTVCSAEGRRSGRQRGFTPEEVGKLAAIFGTSRRRIQTRCANCEGHPPDGYGCLACGARG